MDRQTLTKRIQDVIRDTDRLKQVLSALEITDIERYPDNYETLSIDAAIRGENIACRLRHIIYSTAFTKKTVFLQGAAKEHGIAIESNDEIVKITLPCLLPKRKKRNTEFILDPLYFALNDYTSRHTMQKFNECVVCFSHVYSWEPDMRRIRDYDNTEQKQILDVIATFIMVDDTGLLCDAYNTTECGEKDCTVISIMSKNQFPEWLLEHQKGLKTISDF